MNKYFKFKTGNKNPNKEPACKFPYPVLKYDKWLGQLLPRVVGLIY